MQIKTDGIVIREQTIGESDRLVTILTRSEGVIKAFAKRAKSLKDSKNSSTGLLAYSRFNIYKGRDKYIIDTASPIDVFFDLRRDITSLSLAQYFCELSYLLVPAECDSEEHLRLVLNSIHFLTKQNKPQQFLKTITELRMLSISGYMPDLVACKCCGLHEKPIYYFYPENGIILCEECKEKGNSPYIKINLDVLTAMRYICYSDFSKLYFFSLGVDNLKHLSELTENYMVKMLGHKINTLEFYKSIL